MTTITVKESKVNEIKRKSKEKLRDVKERCGSWYGKHKMEVMLFGSIAVPCVLDFTKILMKRNNLRAERKLRECSIYDPSTNLHYNLRREMTTAEKLELDRRLNTGEESKGEILKDLGVLKK